MLTGGCLCGAIRYELSAMPFDADHCHCRMCQKTTGAVVGSWMDFKIEQITWLNVKPHEYESSEFVRRGFCTKCGSTLSYRDTRYPDYYTLAITSLDEPDKVAANYHIHTDSQLKWLEIKDHCPRYPQGRG